jgi:hypothetical protein
MTPNCSLAQWGAPYIHATFIPDQFIADCFGCARVGRRQCSNLMGGSNIYRWSRWSHWYKGWQLPNQKMLWVEWNIKCYSDKKEFLQWMNHFLPPSWWTNELSLGMWSTDSWYLWMRPLHSTFYSIFLLALKLHSHNIRNAMPSTPW